MKLLFKGTAALVALLLIAGCSSKESVESSIAPANAPDVGSALVDYRGEPNPPREGKNDVKVTVTQPDGSRMTDANVTVTYYMPAMRSMNMPEMRAVFPLAHQGQGIYSSEVRLVMGGTWQVTVDVAQGNESVAKKRFTIIARE